MEMKIFSILTNFDTVNSTLNAHRYLINELSKYFDKIYIVNIKKLLFRFGGIGALDKEKDKKWNLKFIELSKNIEFVKISNGNEF